METVNAAEQFKTLSRRVPVDDYNYEHFGPRYLLRDVRRTIDKAGPAPGEVAPDFELPRADSGSVRLSDLRGKPVLLRFGSWS